MAKDDLRVMTEEISESKFLDGPTDVTLMIPNGSLAAWSCRTGKTDSTFEVSPDQPRIRVFHDKEAGTRGDIAKTVLLHDRRVVYELDPGWHTVEARRVYTHSMTGGLMCDTTQIGQLLSTIRYKRP